MNNIPSSQAVVSSWDKEGALGEDVPSATPAPMEAASSLEEVRRLVAAGARLCSPDHRWLCTHAWLSEKKEDDRAWLTGWTELLAYGPREEQTSLVFELGRCRQAVLLEALMEKWGWDHGFLHALLYTPPHSSSSEPVRWQWSGWLAYHAVAFVGGEHPLLLPALAAMDFADRDRLSPWNRLWLVANAHRVRSARTGGLEEGHATLRKALEPWNTPGPALTKWALETQDLPVDNTHVMRYRALREVLVKMIETVWEQSDPETSLQEGTAKWLIRFFQEEAEGNMRMEDRVYLKLRQDLLEYAWQQEPQAGSGLAPAVWAAVVVSISRFQEGFGASLPSMRGRKVRFDYAQKWVANQPLQEWLDRNRGDAKRLATYALNSGSTLPQEAQAWPWFATWERLLPGLRALTLKRTLPAPRVASPRLRF